MRAYLDKPVPEEVIAQVLDEARHCASWSNTRGYMLGVATGDRLHRLSERYIDAWEKFVKESGVKGSQGDSVFPDGDFETWKKYPEQLRGRAIANGKTFYGHLNIMRGDDVARLAQQRDNYEFFGAPVIILVFVHRGLLPFTAQDAGIMLAHLMLSATYHGLATVPLGNLATWRHPADAEFEVPEDYALITGLAMGYEDTSAQINTYRAEHPSIPLVEPKNN
ncbi:nitroreductase family protein [Arcanobacterium ihumii]|uniref:nitroreductase family protein n=1 Tax=Arcanobacterium ihumii TaxID=2138162 RepID=UPI001F417898